MDDRLSRASGSARGAALRPAAAAGLIGVVLLVVGTFLPWLRSGSVRRNSYRTGGDLQRVLALRGGLHLAVTAWPFLALACAVSVAIFVIGLRRIGAGLAAVLALVVGAVAVAAVRQHPVGPVTIVRAGPVVTLTGATVLFLAATVVMISAGSSGPTRS